MPGYPNLFFLLGPNTGLGHNSIVYMIEAQIAYVMDALRTMRSEDMHSLAVRPEAFRLLERRPPAAAAADGVELGRLLELVHRPERAEHHDLARLHVDASAASRASSTWPPTSPYRRRVARRLILACALLSLAVAPARAADDAQLHGTITPPGADTRHATTEIAAYDDLVQGYPTLTDEELRNRYFKHADLRPDHRCRARRTRRAPA